jgi:hypothetical protein
LKNILPAGGTKKLLLTEVRGCENSFGDVAKVFLLLSFQKKKVLLSHL